MTPLQLLKLEFEPPDFGVLDAGQRDALLIGYLARALERTEASEEQQTAHARSLALAQQIRVLRRMPDRKRLDDSDVSRDILGRIAGLEREKVAAELEAGLLEVGAPRRTKTVTARVEMGF